ncbi:hypothetical protein Q3G72_004214 [Acer saccharum]|nr:hypothetical protein Q3G72_004214 [Acer saccharum]
MTATTATTTIDHGDEGEKIQRSRGEEICLFRPLNKANYPQITAAAAHRRPTSRRLGGPSRRLLQHWLILNIDTNNSDDGVDDGVGAGSYQF